MSAPNRLVPPVFLFDIEAVPDITLLASVQESPFATSSETLWKDVDRIPELVSRYNGGFPPVLYHIPIVICGMLLDGETFEIIDGFKADVGKPQSRNELLVREKELLEKFWQFASDARQYIPHWNDTSTSQVGWSPQRSGGRFFPVTFCGYNIRGYDLPVMELRSIRHHLSCPIEGYVDELDVRSYRYKFASDKVFDIQQFLTNFDSVRGIGLDAMAQSLGLGGKLQGIDGSQVADVFFRTSDMDRIRDYCSVDVIISYCVFLAIQRFRNQLTPQQHLTCVERLAGRLTHPSAPAAYRQLWETSQEYFQTLRLGNTSLL